MNEQAQQLAQLETEYAASVRETQAALVALSASVFNQPRLHDSFRGSEAYQRWQSCHARRDALARSLEALRARRDAACIA